jgi:hypothetical protein
MTDAPIRAISRSPGFHWFGYYDKLQIDPTGRYALGMEVDFEHRSPVADEEIQLGLVDMEDGDTWKPLGGTRAWCWQQGCMLQWIPGSGREIIYNDREDDQFISRLLDTETGTTRTLAGAIYAVAPDGKTAIGTDFRRINHMRPGYGYAGIPDPNHDVRAPDDAGIYTVDLTTGEARLILSIAAVAAIPYPHGDLTDARHYFNHLLFNADGSRFIFLHRWRFAGGGFQTRMLTAAANGTDLHVVDDFGRMSHFIWRDESTILGWAWHPSGGERFYLYRDRSDTIPAVVGDGVMTVNGHCTYLPGGEWILNDTYPSSDSRDQVPYLYHVSTGKRFDLGSFSSPDSYNGEWRCDLHPRSSPAGDFVVIDSAHGGLGRQMYRIDIGKLTRGAMH